MTLRMSELWSRVPDVLNRGAHVGYGGEFGVSRFYPPAIIPVIMQETKNRHAKC